jgi:hypothetical protein
MGKSSTRQEIAAANRKQRRIALANPKLARAMIDARAASQDKKEKK